MKVTIVKGKHFDKHLQMAYAYMIKCYREELIRDRGVCESIDRGTEKGVQYRRSDG